MDTKKFPSHSSLILLVVGSDSESKIRKHFYFYVRSDIIKAQEQKIIIYVVSSKNGSYGSVYVFARYSINHDDDNNDYNEHKNAILSNLWLYRYLFSKRTKVGTYIENIKVCIFDIFQRYPDSFLLGSNLASFHSVAIVSHSVAKNYYTYTL